MSLKLRLLTLAAAVLTVVPLAVRSAAAVNVEISVDQSEDNTRLLLTHSAPAVYVVQSSRTRITIRYAEPVVIQPAERRFDGDILERYRVRDDYTLTLYLGRDFDSYDTFELRNPFRLVVDLQGSHRRRGSRRAPVMNLDEPRTIIVIDPGHGGIEEGAIGPSGLKEKEVTLLLARELKQALQRRDPSISVVLTRDEDRLLSLDERTAIANHNQADLFLSIHLNASPRANANGAETYYLATEATDDEARTLAALENRTRRGSKTSQPTKLDLVLWDLAQNEHLAESSTLAEAVQRQMNDLTGTVDRGVKQAPFRVLMGATMPAILVEVGFISNPQEESRLRSMGYRRRVVGALVAAVEEFLLNLQKFAPPPAAAGQPQVSLQ